MLAAGVALFEAVQLEFCCVLVGCIGDGCKIRRTGLEFIDQSHFDE